MKEYADIGALYLLRNPQGINNLLWAVIENNSNDKTSILMVIEEGQYRGMKATVDSKWLCGIESVGPILPPAGEIVVENGVEFIRNKKEKTLTKHI